jgi:hypothetical protein
MTATKVLHTISECIAASATLVILFYACVFAGINTHVASGGTVQLHTVAHSVATPVAPAHTEVGIGVVRGDGVSVDYHSTPAPLWNALIDAQATYRDGGTDGKGTLTVAVGVAVNSPDQLYLATADGWMECADDELADGEVCSTTGPMTPVEMSFDTVALPVEGGADQLIVEFPSDDVTGGLAEISDALIAEGYSGLAGDGRCAAYVPIGETFYAPSYGEITVTHAGLVAGEGMVLFTSEYDQD